MKRRFISLLLTLCMVLILLPATARAKPASSVTVGGKTLESGKYLANGETTPSDTKPASGGYAHFVNDGTTAILTLHNADITNSPYAFGILSTGDLTIFLEGDSTVTGKDDNSSSRGIWIFSRGLIISGSGSLTTNGGTAMDGESYGVEAGSVSISVSAAVYANGGEAKKSLGIYTPGTLTISDNATLTATGGPSEDYSYGLYIIGGSSICGSAKVTATGGGVTNGNSCGVYGKGSISISEDAIVTATGGTANISSQGVYASDNINISGGIVTAKSTGGTAMNKQPDLSDYTGYQWRTAESDSFTPGTYEWDSAHSYFEIKPYTAPTTYTVTLPTGTGYTVTAQSGSVSPVTSGGSYSFTIDINSGYHEGVGFTVKTNGTPLDADGNGVYTISDITADQTVTVEGVEQDAPTYTVTINGGGSGASGAGDYAAGDAVNINAGTRSNYTFTGWTSSPNINITNAGSSGASFTMPDHNVTVTANWSYNGGSSSGSSYDYYTITAMAGNGGSIYPSGAISVREGLDKTFTITPKDGYIISDVLMDGVSIGVVNQYTFKNLKKPHTIEAVFTEESREEPCNGSMGDNPLDDMEESGTGAVWDSPFTDVSEDDWYYEYVRYVHEQELMQGTAANKFSPEITTDRGMIVTILWRLEGRPKATITISFTDIAEDKYCQDAVAWAAENKIVEGYSAVGFGPEDAVTREQLAAIFHRYAKYKGFDISAYGDLSPFQDKPSDWALKDVQWAVAEGLLQGKGGGIFDPLGNATRCECAAILKRFIEKYELR